MGRPSGEVASLPDWRIAAGLFLLSLCILQWQIRDRIVLVLDEGIYLGGAALVSQGQAPYRDFFTFTGPGTYWIYGAVFRMFGASLVNARLVLSAEIAFICTAIFCLLAPLTRYSFATITALSFLTLCLDAPDSLYVGHRWDSNAWAMAALVLAYTGFARARRSYWVASGACAGIAAWITPPFVIVAALLGVWIAWSMGWRGVKDYFLGVAGPSVVAASVLIYQGAFLKMIDQLLWATTHYRTPNTVSYGYPDTNALANVRYVLRSPLQLARRIEGLIPALLPLLAYLGVVVRLLLRRPDLKQNRQLLVLLVAFSAGVLVAGLPRLGTHQLLFLSPGFWILCGYFLYHGARPGWRSALTVALALIPCLLLISSVRKDRLYSEPVETNAGAVRCTPEDARLFSALQSKITPGAGLFVFPYLPIVYFLTGGVNPTRYSFLQAGMMSGEDEAAAIADLRARPPQWMLWVQFPPSFWTNVWPNTDPTRLNFPALESFMQANYRQSLRIEMVGLKDKQALVLSCEIHSCQGEAFR